MKNKYKSLIYALILKSDCFTIQIESYKKTNIIQDDQYRDIFDKYILPYLNEKTNIEKDFVNYKKRYLKNKTIVEKLEENIIKEIKKIKEAILFRLLTLEYGAAIYPQSSGNLVIGFKISANTLKYLFQVNDIFEWCRSYPSDLSFYHEGKCIFTTIAHERVMYTNDLELYKAFKSKYKEMEYRIDDIYKNINYPYSLNDDPNISF